MTCLFFFIECSWFWCFVWSQIRDSRSTDTREGSYKMGLVKDEERRSYPRDSGDNEILDLLIVGEVVDIAALSRLMPDEIVKKLKSIENLDGMKVSELSEIDLKKLRVAHELRNLMLIKMLTAGEYQNATWSDALRTSVTRWRKTISRSMQEARDSMRNLFQELYANFDKLFPSDNTTTTAWILFYFKWPIVCYRSFFLLQNSHFLLYSGRILF